MFTRGRLIYVDQLSMGFKLILGSEVLLTNFNLEVPVILAIGA